MGTRLLPSGGITDNRLTGVQRRTRILAELRQDGVELRISAASGAWLYYPKRTARNGGIVPTSRRRVFESDAQTLLHLAFVRYAGMTNSGAARYIYIEKVDA